jgi:signal transduction histidine kinase
MMVANAARFGTEKALEPLRRVNAAGTHLLSLINEVLDLSKIEAGKLELNPEAVNLSRLIDEVWLEVECLRLAQRVLGAKEIQRVTIRRLHPKGTRPNWKVADIIPQPSLAVSGKIRDRLAPLTGIYALEDEGE